MKTKTILFLIVLLVGGLFVGQRYMFQGTAPLDIGIAEASVTVHKSPNCGCCNAYISYLKRNGFSVEVENMDDLDPIKEKYNIPRHLRSCHTAVYGDHIVEGHVPLEIMSKMFSEESEVKGLALPGMPSGSPGMPGAKSGPFEVYELDEEGEYKMFMDY